MSLPLSFSVLSAMNRTAIHSTGNEGMIIGDDALVITDNLSDIEKYREKVREYGGVIHPTKDIISECGRCVIGEGLIEKGEWVDFPKIKSVIQPGVDNKNNRWIAAPRNFHQNTRYFPEYRKILREFLDFTYRKEFQEAFDLGIPIDQPSPFGLNLNYWPPNENSFKLSYMNNMGPEELTKEVFKWSSAYNYNPNVVFRSTARAAFMHSYGVNFSFNKDVIGNHPFKDFEKRIAESILPTFLINTYDDRKKKALTPLSVSKSIPDLIDFEVSDVKYNNMHKDVYVNGEFVDAVMDREAAYLEIMQFWRDL